MEDTGDTEDGNQVGTGLLSLPTHRDVEDDLPNVRISQSGSDTESVGLKRQIGLPGLVSFLVGAIIGGGIFASPRSVATYMGSTGGILFSWVGAGIIAIIGALVFCELALTFPNLCASEYSYIYEAFGDLPSFACIYLSTITKPVGLTLLSMIAGDYIMTAAVGHGDSVYSKALAALIIAINMVMNCYSVKLVKRTQIFFTSAKMIPITMLIVTGLVRLGQGHTDNFKDAFNGTTTSVSDIAFSIYGGLYAYGGWTTLNFVTAEAANPVRDIPIAIGIGIPLVILCYIMVNIAYLTVKTPLEIANSSAIAVTIGKEYYGVMHWIIPALVACSVFGSSNSLSFKCGREIYEAANRKHLPALLGSVHRTRHTPIPAIIFASVVAFVILIPEATNFRSLLKFLQFLVWLRLSLAVAAMIWLRRSRPEIERPFKLFIGVPIFFQIINVFLVIAPFIRYPVEQAYGICVLLPAVPVYFAFIKYQILPQTCLQGIDVLTKKIQQFGNLASPTQEEDKNKIDQDKDTDGDT